MLPVCPILSESIKKFSREVVTYGIHQSSLAFKLDLLCIFDYFLSGRKFAAKLP